ncbi:hypothetical protein TNCV_2459271 [Trichonephila clavipes]|nr:hypothetical protein TNCV_2459271 [Trichonephila clavipes]
MVNNVFDETRFRPLTGGQRSSCNWYGSQSPHSSVVWNLGEWVPAQVSSLSFDHDSKLRAPSLTLTASHISSPY